MALTTTAATLVADWIYDPDGSGTAAAGNVVWSSGELRIHQTDADGGDQSGTDLSGLQTPVVTFVTYAGAGQVVLDGFSTDSGVWIGSVEDSFGVFPSFPSPVTLQIAELGVTAGAQRVPVNTLATTARYTTLTRVKERLGVSGTGKDTRLTQAIVAAEVQIDQHLGGGFTGTIPVPIVEAATSIAMAIYKAGDSPTGVAGSDDWLGTIDISDEVRRELQRNPMLVGWRLEWGVA